LSRPAFVHSYRHWSFDCEIEEEALYPHRVLAPVHHRTLYAEWVCSVNGQLQPGLGLVIATIAILRGRVISSRSSRITYLSEGWHVCRYPGSPYCGKSNLRGSWHFRDLGQSWTTFHQSSSTQHEPYHVETSIVRRQGIDIQVSTSYQLYYTPRYRFYAQRNMTNR
jgi:hypothetical protein